MSSIQPDLLPIAAVVHEEHGQADALLYQLAFRLKQRGCNVLGLVQEPPGLDSQGCALDMTLVDIDSGERFGISQKLGKGSTSCCLDPSGVVDAAPVLRNAAARTPSLVFVNRFGKLEAEGAGLHAEFIALIEAGIPVLTAVRPDHLSAWHAFTGGCATELPLDEAAVLRWCDGFVQAQAQ